MISNGTNLARSSQIETLFSEAQMQTFEICLYISTYRATNAAVGAEILVNHPIWTELIQHSGYDSNKGKKR